MVQFSGGRSLDRAREGLRRGEFPLSNYRITPPPRIPGRVQYASELITSPKARVESFWKTPNLVAVGSVQYVRLPSQLYVTPGAFHVLSIGCDSIESLRVPVHGPRVTSVQNDI